MTKVEPKLPELEVAKTLKPASPSRRRLQRWGGWTLALLTVAVAFFVVSNREPEAEWSYQTQTIARGNVVETVTATGNLEPTNQVDLGIEVSGTIASVEVDYNDKVRAGQVLARLETSKLKGKVLESQAALELAQANLVESQASVQEAQKELSRLERAFELSGGRVPSQKELDAAKATLARAEANETYAKAQIAQAQATLEVNQTDLNRAVIYAPINGTILERSVDPGQTVAASFQTPVLFTIAEDLAKMELHVDVDEADVGKVREGQQATFTVDAYPDRTFRARIRQVRFGAQESDGVITYETVLEVDNSDLALRPGMTATADIIVESVENVVLIPNAALRFTPPEPEAATEESGGSLVGQIFRPPRRQTATRQAQTTSGTRQAAWVLRDGSLVEVAVKIGASDGLSSQLLEGDLEPGAEVVTSAVKRTKG